MIQCSLLFFLRNVEEFFRNVYRGFLLFYLLFEYGYSVIYCADKDFK